MRRSTLCLALSTLFAASAASADVRFSADDGLVIRLREIDTRIHLGGRLHLDYAFFDEDVTPMDDDFDVRRGRPELEIEVGDEWKAKFEYEFGVNDHGLRAAWIEWDAGAVKLRAGNQTLPFGLEERMSLNDVVFNERSIASELGPGYGTGVVVSGAGELVGRSRFTLASGVYVEPFGDVDYDRHDSEHLGVGGRATFAPIARKRQVVQIGASVDWRDIGGDDEWGISRRPESNLAATLIGTTLSSVASTLTFGVETAAMFGPVLFQAEYMRTGVERQSSSALSDADFDGAYAQLSWVVTGESHRYSRGLGGFLGVRPRSDFGALELGVRWSMLDGNDSGVLAGEAEDITVGVSWWIRENARLSFNYIRVDAKIEDPLVPDTLISDEPQIFALRFIYHL